MLFKKLDLFFIVEHTSHGEVLHIQLQIIFGKKAIKKTKNKTDTATALVM